ncbi:GNAT family N-acetyltransferase [[Enterobacter] lignolyticus]|uniref:GCN5-related N-acetyltransferase n=1 Tax=Enterobacter lignolyticus (strain SCF1) TaxID=701347 RepID=E3GBH5_ENTLS|nr:GNAT family N-acetyltransferase [[Enterobacter] lignolyticus]ADO50017.1 GCN5-related N-acetyltransferase [[Enterobacter] lignolyticus SCF1]
MKNQTIALNLTIRPASDADIVQLPAIERSAARRFRTVAGLAWLADSEGIDIDAHRQAAAAGGSWVAAVGRVPVGFILAEPQSTALFIREISVHQAWQGRGIGRALLAFIADEARARGCTALTLTTFRDPSWNAPLYARLGFCELDEAEMTPALRQKLAEEAAHGLARESRCAMRLMLNRRAD